MGRQTKYSALMEGRVWHCRVLPRKHKFEYRIFYGLFDLDELKTLAETNPVFNVSRFNLFSLYPRDYGHARSDNQTALDLKRSIQKLVLDRFRAHIDRVELLTMPRILGYAFNPISVFYCYDIQNQLTHLVYEVNNTFGERIDYAFSVQREGEKIQPHGCEKSLHVSPFFDVSGGYRFRQDRQDATIKLTIDYVSGSAEFAPSKDVNSGAKSAVGKTFVASMALKHKVFSAGNLVSVGLRIPLVTLKVTAAIHWQALKLWVKKHRVISKPAPPEATVVTIQQSNEG